MRRRQRLSSLLSLIGIASLTSCASSPEVIHAENPTLVLEYEVCDVADDEAEAPELSAEEIILASLTNCSSSAAWINGATSINWHGMATYAEAETTLARFCTLEQYAATVVCVDFLQTQQ